MTTFKLAKLVYNSGCEVDITPTGDDFKTVFITARNINGKFYTYKIDIESVFLNAEQTEEMIDRAIEMCVYQVR